MKKIKTWMTPFLRSNTPTIVIIIGVILFFVGIFIKVPPDELTTYSIFADECSYIEEYVGGDAYNYIIGASIVSGHIAGAEIRKAIYISFGLLFICAGLVLIMFINKGIDEETADSTETSSAVDVVENSSRE